MTDPDDGSIIIDTDDPEAIEVGDASVTVTGDDGSVVVDLAPDADEDEDGEFKENLALRMSDSELSAIAEDLLRGIEADIQSRAEWETTRARGIDMLGLKLEPPRSAIGSGSAPVEGMSTVRHPVMLEALIRFWANATAELLPADGPVKIKNDGDETAHSDELAEAYEKDFNHYLTVTDRGYYPDTKRTVFWTGFGGSGFKKVYHDPLKRRPVSESVDANDVIVSNAATDVASAQRVTHRISMRPSTMKRMQLAGYYRDVSLGQPTPEQNRVDEKRQSVEGVRQRQDRPEDQPYTLYETCCEIDIDRFAPTKFRGKGVPLPYRVTIDKDSHEVLEIRRNWRETDEECLPREYFVKYPFIDAFGFYGIGLVHILGNTTNALTSAWREMLDAGMFASFPGFLILKAGSKQLDNQMRVPPGGAYRVDAPSGNIRDAAMPLPFHDITPGLANFVEKVETMAKSLGSTPDMPVGEGRQEVPVGTVLATIEQATKIESAIHKGLHTAQSQEFQLLRECFKEDPEAFWRGNEECATEWDEDKLLQALNRCKLVPVADPNVPSHLHRIAKALAIKQLQMGNPELYDARAVDLRILHMIKVDDAESLFAPAQEGPAPDPVGIAKLIDAQTKSRDSQNKVQIAAMTAQTKAAELQTKRDIETTRLASDLVVHANDGQKDIRQEARAGQELALDRSRHRLDVAKAISDAQSTQRQQVIEAQKALAPKPNGGQQ